MPWFGTMTQISTLCKRNGYQCTCTVSDWQSYSRIVNLTRSKWNESAQLDQLFGKAVQWIGWWDTCDACQVDSTINVCACVGIVLTLEHSTSLVEWVLLRFYFPVWELGTPYLIATKSSHYKYLSWLFIQKPQCPTIILKPVPVVEKSRNAEACRWCSMSQRYFDSTKHLHLHTSHDLF